MGLVTAAGTAGVLAADRFTTAGAWAATALCVVACAPAGARWLRVAQREHYLAGSALRFARRWWTLTPLNVALAVAAVAGAVAAVWVPVLTVVTAVAVTVGPVGLALRGRTSPLAWTRRLRTLAAVWAVGELVIVALGVVAGVGAPVAALALLAVPALVDLACWRTAPLERRLADRFVAAAVGRLDRVDPVVVAVTGSYGKTSTKNHIRDLVGPERPTVVTPASFNNRAGLSRAVNEHLSEGTEVFVAEMGTYGPGEIAELCRWCPPTVAVITAIGPVHLERFGSEDRIVEAKSEILERAAVAVLQVDDPRLAAVADRVEGEGRRVLRASARDERADVCVRPRGDAGAVDVLVDGTVLAGEVPLATGVQPTNLACAVAVALALGIAPGRVAAHLAEVRGADHRLQPVTGAGGAVILDDTYNSNPAGAAAALDALVGAPGDGRRVVVTPGMVELGSRQAEENEALGKAVAGVATDLVVVGRTNRRALLAGVAAAGGAGLAVRVVDHRDEAVAWVRDQLGPGDAVLYENDLPDHYP